MIIILSTIILSIKAISQEKVNHIQSKILIERYNKLRLQKNLNDIQHDTILDNNASILLINEKYKKADNTFKIDSIHSLLYKSGIIDYQFEIVELSDNDTVVGFNKSFLTDKRNNIQMGYAKNGKNHIIMKTKKYLKFNHGEVACHTNEIDPLNSNNKITVTTDSIHYFFNREIPGNYYYIFCKEIPSNSKVINLKNKRAAKIIDNAVNNFDIVIIAKENETTEYLVVINESNEIVSVSK